MNGRGRRAAVASLSLVAVTIAGVSAAAQPSWQTVPVTKADDHMAVVASGRVWIFNNGTDSGPFRAKSARISGTKLGSWVTSTVGGSSDWINEGVHGQDLVFLTSPGEQGQLLSVRLQPSGALGKPVATRGAKAPAASGGSSVVQLPDRVIRLVDACDFVPGCGGGQTIRAGACCDTNGEVADYSSFIPPSQRAQTLLGLDRHGRLWLAWTPYRQSTSQQAQVVQLEPDTLAARGKPTLVPGSLGFTQMVDFACTDTCHLVIQAASRAKRTFGTFAWAPGERSATLISVPVKDGIALAVRASPRHLDLAYGGHDQKSALTVGLVRATPKGLHSRPSGTLAIPEGIGSASRGLQRTIGPVGIFGPEGFLAVAVYEPFSGRGKAQIRVALLPLRG